MSEQKRDGNKRYRLTPEEEELLFDYRGNHKALKEECEAVGIPVNNVNYYWYKSEKFSINTKNNSDPVAVFNSYIQSVRENISSSFTWKNVTHSTNTSNKLLVPNIFDLHLGKLAWGEETGEDYDIKIAEERFRVAIEDLINKTSGYNVKKILFPVGNDIYNSDKAFPYAQTTSGTPQMDDTRWQKLFKTGVSLITWAVNRLTEVAPVDVVMVLSNHDLERVFYLGEVISAVFANHPNVTIDNSPKVRKYYKWGNCLIGLAHGHNEKPQNLPLIMAQEARKDWSDTWYREWLCGHLHHKYQLMTQTAKDYSGVKVTYLTSPSSADAWHHSKAFIGSIKGAEAFVYDADEGLVGSAVHNIK